MTISSVTGSASQAATVASSSMRLRLRQTLPMQERPQNAQTAAPSSPQVWNPPPLSTERHPERNALQSEALAGSGRDPSEALFREVSALAETLGYVGLTRTALSRAMAQGGSLLADYRA